MAAALAALWGLVSAAPLLAQESRGAIVGTVVWLTDIDEDWWSLVQTAAYYDNPWEVWAYRAQGNWPPAGANPKLLWPIP